MGKGYKLVIYSGDADMCVPYASSWWTKGSASPSPTTGTPGLHQPTRPTTREFESVRLRRLFFLSTNGRVAVFMYTLLSLSLSLSHTHTHTHTFIYSLCSTNEIPITKGRWVATRRPVPSNSSSTAATEVEGSDSGNHFYFVTIKGSGPWCPVQARLRPHLHHQRPRLRLLNPKPR